MKGQFEVLGDLGRRQQLQHGVSRSWRLALSRPFPFQATPLHSEEGGSAACGELPEHDS